HLRSILPGRYGEEPKQQTVDDPKILQESSQHVIETPLLVKPSPRKGPQENGAEPTDAYESCLEQHNHEKDGNVVDPIEHDVSIWRLSAIIRHDSPQPNIGRWTLIPVGNNGTDYFAWRLDTQTGYLEFCAYNPGGQMINGVPTSQSLLCTVSA